MKELRIDEKWSIWYDPTNNDRPVGVWRNGDFWGPYDGDNLQTAMFYALLHKAER